MQDAYCTLADLQAAVDSSSSPNITPLHAMCMPLAWRQSLSLRAGEEHSLGSEEHFPGSSAERLSCAGK